MNKLEMVKEFRRAFSLPISDVPCVPGIVQLELHTKLIRSEAYEIIDSENVTDILDVIVDLQYFILGLAAESGITEEQIRDWFHKVHSANMRKLWTEEQVLALSDGKEKWFTLHGEGVTHCHHRDASGEWVSAEAPNNEGRYVVRLNGKVQKPPGWKAAVLEGGAV